MDLVAGIAIVVSVSSAIFAGLAWWQTRRQAVASGEMVAIERSREERHAIEAQSARVTIGVESSQGSIELRNVGQAAARSVDFVPEVRIGDTGSMPDLDLSVFPCDIQPGHQVRVPILVAAGNVGRLQVGLTWVDERGQQQEFTSLALS